METELKLDLAAADTDRLAQSMLLGGAATIVPLSATYFDTSEDDLAKAGLTLRIRRQGDRRLQTVKAGGGLASGLFVRPEWEQEVLDDTPVLDAASGPLEAILKGRPVGPRFMVEVVRTQWLLEEDGAHIEVALDRGTIRVAGRSEELAELELELKSGPVGALFAVARRLGKVVPLRLGALSKAERGFRLATGAGGDVFKAAPIRLEPDAEPAAAFATIVQACLRQFRVNEALLLAGDTRPQPLHQARVGLRRLRSAFSLFKPLLKNDPEAERLARALRTLAAALGDVRDLDVFLGHFSGPERARVVAAREAAFAALIAHLQSPETQQVMLDLVEWLATGDWRLRPADPELAREDLPAFAAELLDRRRRRLKRQGRHLARLSDHDRHQARIEAKKLRYAAEFFGTLWTGKKAARRRTEFLTAIEALQEDLGLLNDAATAPALRARLGLPAVEGTSLDGPAVRKRAGKALAALLEIKPFWR